MKMRLPLASLCLPLGMITLSGCMHEAPNHPTPPGLYEHTSRSTDPQGTSHEEKRTTEVYYDEQGRKHVKEDRKTTQDPKGLFNKSTIETHKTVK